MATDLLDAFLANRRSRSVRDTTLRWYRHVLSDLFDEAHGIPLRPEPIEAWLSTSPSQAYANSRITAVRAFYRWAVKRGHIESYPLEDIHPRAPRILPRVFTADEMRTVFDLVRGERDARMTAAFITLADTGVRVGELVSLRTRSLEAGHIVVDGKSGQHRVPVSPETMAALVRLALLDQDAPIFRTVDGRPLTVVRMKELIRNRMARAGLTGAKLGPHTWRHSFATHYLRQGGNIAHLQQILGHSSVQVTERYLHLAQNDVAQEHARVSPLRHLLSPSAPTLLERTG